MHKLGFMIYLIAGLVYSFLVIYIESILKNKGMVCISMKKKISKNI